MCLQIDWWQGAFDETYLQTLAPLMTMKTAEEVEFVVRHAGLTEGARVLDMPCGHGRHSIELVKRGFVVTGLDYSEDMLREARKAVEEAAVSVQFVQGDMRSPQVGSDYDVVAMLGNSFGYFDDEENAQVINGVYAAVKSGGVFVLDLPNTAGMLRSMEPSGVSVREEIPNSSVKHFKEHYTFDRETMVRCNNWEITMEDGEVIKKQSCLRLYLKEEMEALLAQVGFTVESVWGDYDDSPHSLDSRRLIVVARK